jgi:hypothetical protein
MLYLKFIVFIKHRVRHRTRFLSSCFHRPPPIVGRPRLVKESDRHGLYYAQPLC